MTATNNLDGQVVLITGAGSGIGRAAAVAVAGAGARTIGLVDIDVTLAEETAHLIEKQGSSAIVLQADVGQADAVREAVATIVRNYGRLDSAFNNVGISQSRCLTADIDPDEWDRIFRINVLGTWLCMREELKQMVAQGGGVIVNTASAAGLRTVAGSSAYVASKHAVVGLTRNAAMEYAGHEIRVNAVCPGGVKTPMLNEAVLAFVGKEHITDEERAGAFEVFSQVHPMKRLGEAHEIADAVVFLLSNQASFITGQCLSVDGGWTAQ